MVSIENIEKSKISVQRTSDVVIDSNSMVTVYYAPNFMLITGAKKYASIDFKKISNDFFINTHTGELKQVNHNENDYRSIGSLRKTFSRLSLIINSNYIGDKSEVFVSISYAKRILDYDELNRDIKNLWARFQRKNKMKISYRCLVIIEYQNQGNPHLHLLLKRLDGELLSIDSINEMLSWDKGTIDIQRLYDSCGLAEYLNPFLVTKKRKRLKYYKRGIQIYRCYGKFIKAQKKKMLIDEALKLAVDNNLIQVKSESFDIISNKTKKTANKIIKIKMKEGNKNGKSKQ